MALRRFLPVAAYDPDLQTLVDFALGYVYDIDDTEYTTPLEVFDSTGNAIENNNVQVANGVLQEFQVHDRDVVRAVFGDIKLPVWSPDSLVSAAAASAAAAANAANDAAGSVAGQIDAELAAKLKYAAPIYVLQPGQTEADLPPDFPVGPYSAGGPPPIVLRERETS